MTTALALAALLLTAAPAGAAQTPRHAARKTAAKKPAPKRPARHRGQRPPAPHPADPTAVTWPRRLAPGRWSPEVADALERLLQQLGKDSTDYSASDPPAAVLTLDDAAMTGSPGGVLFARLTAEAAFSFNEDFWKQVPPHYGGPAARAGWLTFKDQPPAVWPHDPHYLMYRKAMHGALASLAKESPRTAARWLAALLTGLKETEVQRMVRQVTAEALRRPLAAEEVGDSSEDPRPARAFSGLRTIPEMLDLTAKLLENGFDVWLVSPSNQYSALEAARLFGVHPSRVLGVRQKVADGLVGTETLSPLPVGTGVAEALTLFLGRSPMLAVGTPQDGPMLDYDDGAGLRVLLCAPGAAPADAGRKGWLVQAPFSPVREPQEARYPPPPGAAPAPPPEEGQEGEQASPPP